MSLDDTLPAAKVDAQSLPGGADPRRYLRASDYNALRAAIVAPNEALVTATGSTTARSLAAWAADAASTKSADLSTDDLHVFADEIGRVVGRVRANGNWELAGRVVSARRELVLLESDMFSDVDDVGDLTTLSVAARLGDCEIAGIVISGKNPAGAPAARAVADYYGHSGVMIGAYQGSTIPTGVSVPSPSVMSVITDQYRPGDTRANYPAALDAFRAILMDADRPVVLVATGHAVNLAELLAAPASGVYPSGLDLIRTKVKRLVAVAGFWPASGNAEYNILRDPANWNALVAAWPTEIQWVGIQAGDTVYSGPPLTDDPLVNPVRKAYQWAATVNAEGKRQAWGQLGVLLGVYGAGTYLSLDAARGAAAVDAVTGVNSWVASATGPHRQAAKAVTDGDLETRLDALLAIKPSQIAPANTATVHLAGGNTSNPMTSVWSLGVTDPGLVSPVPLDAFGRGAFFAFGVHKINPEYAGPCIQVKVGSTLTDIGFNVSGVVDSTALLAAAGGGDALVAKWYDQSGNGRHAAAESGYEPKIVASGVVITNATNGLPAVQTSPNVDNHNRCLYVPFDIPAGTVSIFSASRLVSGSTWNAWGNRTVANKGLLGPTLVSGQFYEGIDAASTGTSGSASASNIDLFSYVPGTLSRFINGAAAGSVAATYSLHLTEMTLGAARRAVSAAYAPTMNHQAFVASSWPVSTAARTALFAALNAKLGYY